MNHLIPDPVDVIIPTLDNPEYLYPCVQSLLLYGPAPLRLIVVNNGHADVVKDISSPRVTVVQAPHNLGWEGGLKAGLEHSTSKLVVFSNDDIFIPPSSTHWLRNLSSHFRNPKVGAVGPSSNVVMGHQNIWTGMAAYILSLKFLIGFFVMVRRSALDAVGGIDDTLPGGDDLDLSIRLRKGGYSLLNDRSVFVYHHGFKTGQRLHGAGWNSAQMTETTNNALIRKHGFSEWLDLFTGFDHPAFNPNPVDHESNAVRAILGDLDDRRVLEVACGRRKVYEHSVGVDLVPQGDRSYLGDVSTADLTADALDLPFGAASFDVVLVQHFLEHVIDPLIALDEWRRVLVPGGRLIITAPNQELCSGILLDPTHVHAWTPDAVENLARRSGSFSPIYQWPDTGNGFSFLVALEAV